MSPGRSRGWFWHFVFESQTIVLLLSYEGSLCDQGWYLLIPDVNRPDGRSSRQYALPIRRTRHRSPALNGMTLVLALELLRAGLNSQSSKGCATRFD